MTFMCLRSDCFESWRRETLAWMSLVRQTIGNAYSFQDRQAVVACRIQLRQRVCRRRPCFKQLCGQQTIPPDMSLESSDTSIHTNRRVPDFWARATGNGHSSNRKLITEPF